MIKFEWMDRRRLPEAEARTPKFSLRIFESSRKMSRFAQRTNRDTLTVDNGRALLRLHRRTCLDDLYVDAVTRGRRRR